MEVDKINNRRSKFISLFFILLIVFINVYREIKPVNALEGYDLIETFTDIYQVNASIDDAYLNINSIFNNDFGQAYVKNQYLDTYVGLKFDNVSRISNSTHTTHLIGAYLSFYSDQVVYPDYPCPVTVYPSEHNGLGFDNYTDLLNRPLHPNPFSFNLENLHSSNWINSTNFNNQVAGWFNTTAQNETFIILSSNGDGIRYFRTYDYNASLAPRLYLVWELYELKDDYGTWVEEYRGYDIYQGASNWLNYSEFTVTDVGAGTLTIHNSSMMEMDTIPYNGDVYAIKSDTDDIINVMFGIDTTQLDDKVGATTESWGYIYAISQNNGWLEDVDENIVLQIIGNDNSNQHYQYHLFAMDGGMVYRLIDKGNWYTKANKLANIHYLNLTMNADLNTATLQVYSDLAMTNLLETLTGDASGSTANVAYHYAFACSDHNGGTNYNEISGYLISDIENDELISIVDENNTLIDTVTTVPEARDFIDDLYAEGSADSLPYLGDWILVILGMTGLVMIPMSFILMGQSFQTGDYAEGLQKLLILFITGASLLIVWLWG